MKFELKIEDPELLELPPDFDEPEYRLDLSGCWRLAKLPEIMSVPVLSLARCTGLTELPKILDVVDLDLSGCVRIRELPPMRPHLGRLNLSGCEAIRALPPGLSTIAELDVSGCASLTELPEGLVIGTRLEVAGTRLTKMAKLRPNARLTWRGVRIRPTIALYPERITAAEVYTEKNAELRRVLLERMGYENFLQQANAIVLDEDTDPGGPRKLFAVDVKETDLVVLSVRCPSTGRQYLLRVPPSIESCHAAAAWIAGFDDPQRYRPLKET